MFGLYVACGVPSSIRKTLGRGHLAVTMVGNLVIYDVFGLLLNFGLGCDESIFKYGSKQYI